jgi:hypothetical protein
MFIAVELDCLDGDCDGAVAAVLVAAVSPPPVLHDNRLRIELKIFRMDR